MGHEPQELDAPRVVPTVRVEPAGPIRSPVMAGFQHNDLEEPEPPETPSPTALLEAARRLAKPTGWAVGMLLIGFAGTGDLFVSTLAGIAAGVVRSIQVVDRGIPFTFGEGFVGFRADLGWPRGVQEDDDMHWSWPGRTVGASTSGRSDASVEELPVGYLRIKPRRGLQPVSR